jgi:hypothetical protein
MPVRGALYAGGGLCRGYARCVGCIRASCQALNDGFGLLAAPKITTDKEINDKDGTQELAVMSKLFYYVQARADHNSLHNHNHPLPSKACARKWQPIVYFLIRGTLGLYHPAAVLAATAIISPGISHSRKCPPGRTGHDDMLRLRHGYTAR